MASKRNLMASSSAAGKAEGHTGSSSPGLDSCQNTDDALRKIESYAGVDEPLTLSHASQPRPRIEHTSPRAEQAFPSRSELSQTENVKDVTATLSSCIEQHASTRKSIDHLQDACSMNIPSPSHSNGWIGENETPDKISEEYRTSLLANDVSNREMGHMAPQRPEKVVADVEQDDDESAARSTPESLAASSESTDTYDESIYEGTQEVAEDSAEGIPTTGIFRGKSGLWLWFMGLFAVVVLAGALLAAYHCQSRNEQATDCFRTWTDTAVKLGHQAARVASKSWTQATSTLAELSRGAAYVPASASRTAIVVGVNASLSSLAVAMNANNELSPAPAHVRAKRNEAARFTLAETSLIQAPLTAFLDLSAHSDEHLRDLILEIGRFGTFTAREHELLQRDLEAMIFGQFMLRWDPFGFQQAAIDDRMKMYILAIHKRLHQTIATIEFVIPAFQHLKSVTLEVVDASQREKEYLLEKKSREAANYSLPIRLVSCILKVVPEPASLASLTKNIDLAQSMHDWAGKVVQDLENISYALSECRSKIAILEKLVISHRQIRWTMDTRSPELHHFLGQMAEAIISLNYANDIWRQQKPMQIDF